MEDLYGEVLKMVHVYLRHIFILTKNRVCPHFPHVLHGEETILRGGHVYYMFLSVGETRGIISSFCALSSSGGWGSDDGWTSISGNI